PAAHARVSPYDRGFLFADGVYDAVRNGPALADSSGPRFVAMKRHVRRLRRSLGELRIDFDANELARVSAELVTRSGIGNALIYFQVTRGTPDLATQPARSHTPPAGMRPTVFAFVRPAAPVDFNNPAPPVKSCVTMADLRWRRCDIKSIGLLGNALASRAAAEAGADEAILLRDGFEGWAVSEGALTNVLVVTEEGELVTPEVGGGSVLPGITREVLMDLEPRIRKGLLTEKDLRAAREVMLLGTTAAVTSVVSLDGRPVSGGVPGPEAVRLARQLAEAVVQGREDIPDPEK
ncbi:MAG: aminotransferase class IV, partial [Phycisphaerales bacterium]|nr:aminotransferase class IV [Phycisphaerales bacterium]